MRVSSAPVGRMKPSSSSSTRVKLNNSSRKGHQVSHDNRSPYIGLTLAVQSILIAAAPASCFAALIGSGSNLSVPNPNPAAPFVCSMGPAQCNGWDATTGPISSATAWIPPAGTVLKTEWTGTFSVSGSSGVFQLAAGNSTLDFSNLTNTPASPGSLPVQSLISIGDLDHANGLGTEELVLAAKDSNGIPLNVPWLSEVIWTNATTSSVLPMWTYDGAGKYTFDGDTVAGNPAIFFFMETLEPVSILDINKSSEQFGIEIQAQHTAVPEPSSFAMICCIGLVGIAVLKVRQLLDRKQLQ